MNVKCDHCGIEKEITTTDGWQMQHLHFSENEEIQYLTCDKCKLVSPMEYLEKIESRTKENLN